MNKAGPERDAKETIYSIPLAMTQRDGKMKRNGPRELLLDTARRLPNNLTIMTGCLATKILFADERGSNGELRAIGVELLQGAHLYAADPKAKPSNPGVKRQVFVKDGGEVIVAAGAYNTPQLLKLSGIGPREELEKFGIQVLLEKRGVGTNLQDRYEVGVISEVTRDFDSVERCTFGAPGDPCLADWNRNRGPYNTNGAPIGIVKRSSVATGSDPDLFIFGGPAYFRGYMPGYSDRATRDKRHFTWAVLKAHTENRAGTVTLRSADPRDVPEIDFKYFEDGDSAASARDLQAVADGVKLAREIAKHAELGLAPLFSKYEEKTPGPATRDADPAREDWKTKNFIQNEAWGHHASCTCPMGRADDPNAVLDGRFRVRGTQGLRVVDASVFPNIPGFFIVVPIYMISEKATDVLLRDHGQKPRVAG
jgi:choline dehydrogenase